MGLRHLRYFVAMASHGSFDHTAEVLVRLRISTTADCFFADVHFLRWLIFRRQTSGVSWHPISTPIVSASEASESCRYRIETADADGNRTVALGSLLCFFFKVTCL